MPGGKLGNQYLGQSRMCSSFGKPSGSLQRKVIGEQSLSCLKRGSFCAQYTNGGSGVFSPGAYFRNILLVTSEKAHITSQTFCFIFMYIYTFGVTLGIKALWFKIKDHTHLQALSWQRRLNLLSLPPHAPPPRGSAVVGRCAWSAASCHFVRVQIPSPAVSCVFQHTVKHPPRRWMDRLCLRKPGKSMFYFFLI